MLAKETYSPRNYGPVTRVLEQQIGFHTSQRAESYLILDKESNRSFTVNINENRIVQIAPSDDDHISEIHSITRKTLQEKQTPVIQNTQTDFKCICFQPNVKPVLKDIATINNIEKPQSQEFCDTAKQQILTQNKYQKEIVERLHNIADSIKEKLPLMREKSNKHIKYATIDDLFKSLSFTKNNSINILDQNEIETHTKLSNSVKASDINKYLFGINEAKNHTFICESLNSMNSLHPVLENQHKPATETQNTQSVSKYKNKKYRNKVPRKFDVTTSLESLASNDFSKANYYPFTSLKDVNNFDLDDEPVGIGLPLPLLELKHPSKSKKTKATKNTNIMHLPSDTITTGSFDNKKVKAAKEKKDFTLDLRKEKQEKAIARELRRGTTSSKTTIYGSKPSSCNNKEKVSPNQASDVLYKCNKKLPTDCHENEIPNNVPNEFGSHKNAAFFVSEDTSNGILLDLTNRFYDFNKVFTSTSLNIQLVSPIKNKIYHESNARTIISFIHGLPVTIAITQVTSRTIRLENIPNDNLTEANVNLPRLKLKPGPNEITIPLIDMEDNGQNCKTSRTQIKHFLIVTSAKSIDNTNFEKHVEAKKSNSSVQVNINVCD